MPPEESEVVAEPESTLGRFKVHVGELVLPMSTEGDGTPRMRDIEWGRMLGFERPRNIRKLILRMINDGKLRGVDVRSSVERTSMPRGSGVRETTVDAFWLTREQCLLVATQSNAPNAWNLTELMIKVFEAVLKLGGVDAVRAVLHAQEPARPVAPARRVFDPIASKAELAIISAAQEKLEAKRAIYAQERLEARRAFEAEMAERQRALEAAMIERHHALKARPKRKN